MKRCEARLIPAISLHFGVSKSQNQSNLKVKSEISVCTAIMLNDHSNPIASVPGLPRSVRDLIMRMQKTGTRVAQGRPGMIHYVRVGQWQDSALRAPRGVDAM